MTRKKQHWLVKQEPEGYPWETFVKERGTFWDGVRNFQARNHLRSMKKGDQVLYYHSGKERAVVGIAKVTREAYPDPTADDPQWVAVDLAPVRALKNPVSLSAIKADPSLAQIALVRQSRLSVMPLAKEEFDRILELQKEI